MTDDTGLIAGRFRVGGLLGSGGTASVFRAYDDVTGQTVAIKLLHPHLSSADAVREAFLLEARRTAHVAHPGIVAVIDLGTFDEHGTPIAWIAQQLVEGVTLAEHLRTVGPLPVQDAAEIACDVLDALAAAHAGGLVHRDVSPANVMIRVDDLGIHATLLDFGLADLDGETARGDDVVRSSVTETTAGVVGNAAFASPEQLSGRPVGPQGDLYQVGGLLYFTLTGRPPFAGTDRAALVRLHLHAPPPVPSVAVRGIPAAMDQIVVQAMVKNPSDRFADAGTMRDAIRAAVSPVAVGDDAGSTRIIGMPTTTPAFDTRSYAHARSVGEGPRVSSTRPVSERSAPAWGTVVTIIALLAAVATAVPLVASAGRSVPLPQIEHVVTTSVSPQPMPPSATPSDTPSSPPATSVVPMLGTLAEARTALAAMGLGVGDVVERDAPSPAGTVLASDPPSGATVPRGSLVALSVASGANIIPEVTGMDTATAVSTMSAAGFSPTVSTFPSDRPTGTVARIEPAAGTALPLGGAVSVFVSAAKPTPSTTPPTSTSAPTPSPTPSSTASPTPPLTGRRRRPSFTFVLLSFTTPPDGVDRRSRSRSRPAPSLATAGTRTGPAGAITSRRRRILPHPATRVLAPRGELARSRAHRDAVVGGRMTETTTEVLSPTTPQVQPTPRSLKSAPVVADRVFRTTTYAAGTITVAVMLAVGIFLTARAGDALSVAGPSFLTTQEWSPETGTFGVAAVLFGTVTIALVAMSISVPLAMGTALLISEIVPPRARGLLITMVDLMAAVPSVVFGLWGVFFLQSGVIPVAQWISIYFGWVPIFRVADETGARLTDAGAYTSSAFIAGIVVALMVVPTQTSVMREAFSQAPLGEREGALALGSTRWGMIRAVVLPFGRGGIIGGTMLGLGRALGETIAVVMIISPIFTINTELLKTGTNSVSALIALRYGEASQFGLSALMAAGLVLFIITLIVNFTASTIVARSRSGAESN